MQPVVGMGVTETLGSDRYPYTVVQVISAREIVVQRDAWKRISGTGESVLYELTPNPNGELVTLTMRSNGRWVRKGESMKRGNPWHVGRRDRYNDPHF